MEEELASLTEHPDLEVVVEVGTEYWDQGVVTLTVRGDGTVQVRQLRSGAVRVWSGERDQAAIAAFGELAARHRFTIARTSELPRLPDDTPLRLALSRGGEERFSAALWSGDRFKDKDLDAILRAADKLSHDVSGGVVGYP